MDFFITFQSVSMLFLLIVIGFAVGRLGLVSLQGQQELSSLILNVTMPATIIMAFQMEFSQEKFHTAINIMIITALAFVLMIALSHFLARFYKVSPQHKDIIELAGVLPNTSFMGYPLIISILGQEALFYAVLGVTIVFEVVAWTYGAYVISRNSHKEEKINIFKTIILSPGILSIIVGFTFFISSFIIPDPFNRTLGLLSQATSPMAMLMVGISLSRTKVKETLGNYRLYLIAITRLLVLPLLICGILTLLGIGGMERLIPVILLGMPTAVYVAMFAARFESDANFASQIVFISSLLSLFTIPLLVILVS